MPFSIDDMKSIAVSRTSENVQKVARELNKNVREVTNDSRQNVQESHDEQEK